jgi:predicted Zn-dependent peptidase
MSVEVTTLPSGLTVVTDAMPHLETASLGVWVGAGSRDELPNEHGISHLLEHMAFKGTQRRNARQIAEEIEAVGGDLNAATSIETTTYYARVLKPDVPMALDVLSDILANPAFEIDELARERNVIVQEIGAAEDTPDDIVFDHLQSTAFPNQPIGRSVLGTRESVCSFTADSLRTYLKRNYRAADMVIAATGSVEHSAILERAEKLFTAFDGPVGPVPQGAKYGGGTYVEKRDLEQAHLAFALEGLPQRDPALYSLQVFTNVLGGGMSSRLFQEVREVRGLCYTISTFHMPYSDTGLFALYSGTDDRDAPELMQVVVDEMARAAETVTETEVNRAKAQMKAGLLMALESSSARAEQIARQIMVHGRVIPTSELIAKIDAVTVESARAAGRSLLARSRPAIAALGPGRGIDRAASIVENFAKLAA